MSCGPHLVLKAEYKGFVDVEFDGDLGFAGTHVTVSAGRVKRTWNQQLLPGVGLLVQKYLEKVDKMWTGYERPGQTGKRLKVRLDQLSKYPDHSMIHDLGPVPHEVWNDRMTMWRVQQQTPDI